MTEIERLSPWWRRSVIVTIVACFAILGWVARRAYSNAPPIPQFVRSPSGEIVFTGADIRSGQQIFLKHGLMENGTIWGHGAYMGPDFSAQYLHTLTVHAQREVANHHGYFEAAAVRPSARRLVDAEVVRMLKQNRYDPTNKTLWLSDIEATSFHEQLLMWRDYFAKPEASGGLPANYLDNPAELRQLVAFFAWAAWASTAERPGSSSSYTNNFPYEPYAGNRPTAAAVLWSALSLIALLGMTAAVLFIFGRWDFLGWRRTGEHMHPHLLAGPTTVSQSATIKYFAVVALMFLAQVMVGAGVEHYRADPASFFGFDLSAIFPSQILRTWHLQLAVLWVATSYVAGGLFLAPAVGGAEPKHQGLLVNLLFIPLVIIVAGSLLGEWLGVRQMLGRFWMWFGEQGWEYLDLGRAWQILLSVGLVFWLILVARAIRPALKHRQHREIAWLFLLSASAIPIFYLPAFFYRVDTNYAVADLWRFWIIHLWVEGFLELFATAAVAMIFYQLGMVTHLTASRVVYLDALLYLGSGIIGTGHHWYFTGQPELTMALGAVFSAMEVVPLTLLTLDAWDFVQLTRGHCGICNQSITVPHKWTFYFLMAVGFWNFVGAAVFGFLINLPIVSYFEVGTMLTPNHGHAAFIGVFGMLAIALMVFAYRQVLTDEAWADVERYIRISFWGLNIGLALMLAANLFPGGILQLYDVVQNGYWHARSPAFRQQPLINWIEWARMPGDLTFLLAGVVPLVFASAKVYLSISRLHKPQQGLEVKEAAAT